jgi:hypothetical protein
MFFPRHRPARTLTQLFELRKERDAQLAEKRRVYPHLPLPTARFWVIFDNQLRPLPQVTKPTWPAVFTRSLEMATRAATITAIRHLFAQAEIARLKHGGEMSKYSARDYCARVTDENS